MSDTDLDETETHKLTFVSFNRTHRARNQLTVLTEIVRTREYQLCASLPLIVRTVNSDVCVYFLSNYSE